MSLMKRNNLVFPSLLDEVFNPDWFGGHNGLRNPLPPVNIRETDRSFELELAIPGQRKEDFNIEVDKQVLTITMEKKSEKEEVDTSYTRREFSYTSFKRAFTLPETVNEDAIEADYVDGILKFSLPKKEEALPKPKRLIELS